MENATRDDAPALDGFDLARVRRLLDQQDVIDCIIRTTRGADRTDWELFRTAYHPDAVEDHGSYVGDLDGVTAFIANAMTYFSGTQRYVGNFTVDIDGDDAHCESYYLVALRRPDEGKVMLSGGRYLDRLERRGRQWAIVARVVVGEWGATLTATSLAAGEGPLGSSGFAPSRRDRDDVSYERPLTVRPDRRVPT